jgi:hypothetical protein
MSGNTAMDYRNPNTIRKLGIKALSKELGPVGMARFIRQYDNGEGDYTAEREELLAGITMEDIQKELDASANK